jgi:hypothetical protein
MSMSTEKKNDLQNIIAKMSVKDRLQLIEDVAHSLRRRQQELDGAAQRENIMKMMEKLETMPNNNPDNGLSAKDHDKIIYGG